MAYLWFLLAVVSLKVGALEACVKYEEKLIEHEGKSNRVDLRFESLDNKEEILSIRITDQKERCYVCFLIPPPAKHSLPNFFKAISACKITRPATEDVIKYSDIPVPYLHNICEEDIPDHVVVRLNDICDALRLRGKAKGD